MKSRYLSKGEKVLYGKLIATSYSLKMENTERIGLTCKFMNFREHINSRSRVKEKRNFNFSLVFFKKSGAVLLGTWENLI